MNKNITSFLVLIILSVSFAQNQLKVATYNIQGMRPGTDWETRTQHIIENFKQLDPDIIGLQEICAQKTGDPQNQAVTIANALSSYFGIEYHVHQQKVTDQAWYGTFKQFDGIISKYPFKEKDSIRLTGGWPQSAVFGLFDTPIGEILFFTTHLSYETAKVNETEIQELLNFASTKRAIHSNGNAIIVGDFNTEPDRPSYPMMINANYIDTYAAINPNSDGFTAPYPNPIMRIDYIFVNSFSDLVIDDSYLIMDQPISQDFYCSDHLGIITIFSNPLYVGIAEDMLTQNSFSLSQNYPNPFNPITVVKYTIPSSEILSGANNRITLKVYNTLGSEVATLVNEYQQQGEYEVQFDASDLSNGLYFYTLEYGDKTLTKKLLFLK